MKKKRVLKMFFCLVAFSSIHAYAAPKTYKIVGTVEKISSNAFLVSTETDTLEFSYENGNIRLPTDLKVGDQITVWYSLNAQMLTVQEKSNSQKRQPIIMDDRAFYNVKNNKSKSDNSPNDS